MSENNLALDLAVGRSSVRQRILVLLMDETAGRLHLREIQRRAGTSPGTASRELARLVATGLIDREAEGNQVYFRASASPIAAMLRTVLLAMPAQQRPERPQRVPRAGSGAKAPPVADAAAVDSALPLTAPAPTDSLAPAVLVDASAALGQPPRVMRPGPAARSARADPLGLRIAGRLAQSIREIYGDALKGIYLYGARAAGPAPAEADVETIVVLDTVDHYGAELERTSRVCADLSHEMGVVVSRIFVSEAEWNGGAGGAVSAIRAEAVAL
jgi:DNA-binding transcriptional ArsR family regulator